eukprot:80951-Amphidinium_carterae.1
MDADVNAASPNQERRRNSMSQTSRPHILQLMNFYFAIASGCNQKLCAWIQLCIVVRLIEKGIEYSIPRYSNAQVDGCSRANTEQIATSECSVVSLSCKLTVP